MMGTVGGAIICSFVGVCGVSQLGGDGTRMALMRSGTGTVGSICFLGIKNCSVFHSSVFQLIHNAVTHKQYFSHSLNPVKLFHSKVGF